MITTLTSLTPAASPVSVAEMRQWLKEPPHEEDSFIGRLLKSATERIEAQTGIALSRRQFVYAAREGVTSRYAPGVVIATGVSLPRGPLVSVESVKVVDYKGDETALIADEDYYVSLAEGRITLAQARSLAIGDYVQVEFTAGYESAAAVPEALREAVMLTVADRFLNRTSIITGTVVASLPNNVREILLDSGYLRVTV